MKDIKSLRVFVAMPGTTMGATAKYPNPDQLKRIYLLPSLRD